MVNSKTLDLLHDRGQQGTGSFQSWHVNEYDVRGDPPSITTLPNICEGSLGRFPMLDVMPGAASAINDGLHMPEWGAYISKYDNGVSNADMDFELSHGALQGYKTGTGGDNPFAEIQRWPKEFAQMNRHAVQPTVANDAIDHVIAEAGHGWHALDETTLGMQKQLNFQHNRGFAGIDESGRRYGLERGWNPSILPENAHNIPTTSDTSIPMESPDEININGEAVNPEDIAAGGVATSGGGGFTAGGGGF